MNLTSKAARLFTVLLVSSAIGWSTGCAEKTTKTGDAKTGEAKTDAPEAGSNKTDEEVKLPSE